MLELIHPMEVSKRRESRIKYEIATPVEPDAAMT